LRLKAQGSGFRVEFRVHGSGFRVLKVRVQGIEIRVPPQHLLEEELQRRLCGGRICLVCAQTPLIYN